MNAAAAVLVTAAFVIFTYGPAHFLARAIRARRTVQPEPTRPDLPRRHVIEITTAEWVRIYTEDGWAKTIAEIDALPEVTR